MSSLDLDYISNVKITHGVLAALAWVVFFPAGAISLRILSSRHKIWIHAASQTFAYILFTIAVALGIHLVFYLKAAGSDLFKFYHTIIGLLVFGLVFFQAALGWAHHAFFKQHRRRTFWTHAHLWLGRLLITLGMINGGLGLLLTRQYQNVRNGEIVYGVCAGLVWCVFVGVAVHAEVKRPRAGASALGKTASSSDQSTVAADVETAGEKVETR